MALRRPGVRSPSAPPILLINLIMLSMQQRKAETARVKVEARALELGVVFNRPLAEGTRYDCILDIKGKLYRTQIKYGGCLSAHAAGAVTLRLRSNIRPRRGEMLHARRGGCAYGLSSLDR